MAEKAKEENKEEEEKSQYEKEKQLRRSFPPSL